MKASTLLILLFTVSTYGQAYLQMDGGYNGHSVPFSLSTAYKHKVIAGRVNYYQELVERDVWAAQVGIFPVWNNKTMVAVWVGQEFVRNTDGKFTVEVWRQIEPSIFITGGVGNANNSTYGHVGLTLQLVRLKEKKVKRFY